MTKRHGAIHLFPIEGPEVINKFYLTAYCTDELVYSVLKYMKDVFKEFYNEKFDIQYIQTLSHIEIVDTIDIKTNAGTHNVTKQYPMFCHDELNYSFSRLFRDSDFLLVLTNSKTRNRIAGFTIANTAFDTLSWEALNIHYICSHNLVKGAGFRMLNFVKTLCIAIHYFNHDKTGFILDSTHNPSTNHFYDQNKVLPVGQNRSIGNLTRKWTIDTEPTFTKQTLQNFRLTMTDRQGFNFHLNETDEHYQLSESASASASDSASASESTNRPEVAKSIRKTKKRNLYDKKRRSSSDEHLTRVRRHFLKGRQSFNIKEIKENPVSDASVTIEKRMKTITDKYVKLKKSEPKALRYLTFENWLKYYEDFESRHEPYTMDTLVEFYYTKIDPDIERMRKIVKKYINELEEDKQYASEGDIPTSFESFLSDNPCDNSRFTNNDMIAYYRRNSIEKYLDRLEEWYYNPLTTEKNFSNFLKYMRENYSDEDIELFRLYQSKGYNMPSPATKMRKVIEAFVDYRKETDIDLETFLSSHFTGRIPPGEIIAYYKKNSIEKYLELLRSWFKPPKNAKFSDFVKFVKAKHKEYDAALFKVYYNKGYNLKR